MASVPYNGLHDDTEINNSLTTVLVNSETGIDEYIDEVPGYEKVGNSSYVIRYNSYEEAQDAVSKMTNDSVQADMDFVFHITNNGLTVDQTGSEDALQYVSYSEELASGKSLRQIADETGKKLVAVIDSHQVIHHTHKVQQHGADSKEKHGIREAQNGKTPVQDSTAGCKTGDKTE